MCIAEHFVLQNVMLCKNLFLHSKALQKSIWCCVFCFTKCTQKWPSILLKKGAKCLA